MDDLISRKAVIDAHYEYCNKHPDAGFPVWSLKILEDLPSAQPDVPDTNVGDTISRQVVVDTVHKIILGFFSEKNGAMTDTEKTLLSVNKAVCNELAKLPSAQAEIIVCGDCKHWSRESICDGFCSEDCMRHDEDFYCGYAERREE